MLLPQTEIETREGGAVPLAGERRPAMAGDSKGGASPLFATARTARSAECPRPDGRGVLPPSPFP
jgi:hypothetical protein